MKSNNSDNATNRSIIGRCLRIMGLILYELQPVRPDYAFNVISSSIKFSYDLISVLLTKYLILFLKVVVRIVSSISLRSWIYATVWSLSWACSVYVEFGSVFVMLSIVGLMFSQLGERKKGELSAYSVFNKNFENILGTLTAEEIDNHIRHR